MSNQTEKKPRLLVITDISSLTAGLREPDDGQSMIRLMLYSNEFTLEGLIASSNLGHGQVTRPELIHEIISAYAQVYPNLLLHSSEYPSPHYLHERVYAGQPVAGPRVPVFESIGSGKETSASQRIIEVTDKPDPRPLWITLWGGSADLAQALWTVRETRSPEEVMAFVEKLRIHAVYDQDSTGHWIKKTFPTLFYITRDHGIRGMYRGGDTSPISSEWVETHIRSGHGVLGALYPNYNGGDIWAHKLGHVRGIKEGDTPSYLGLLPNGLNLPGYPTLGGWGGRYEPVAETLRGYTDTPDTFPTTSEFDPDPRISTVYRWRSAYQADFQARLDWCVQPYEQANHAPIARIAGPLEYTIKSGNSITLDASTSSDPDGDMITFEWSIYPALLGDEMVRFEKVHAAKTMLTIPHSIVTPRFRILLSARDQGNPPLTGYQSVVFTIE